MAQRISRAKQSIQGSGVPFERPAPEDAARRLGAVLHVLLLAKAARLGDARREG